VGSGGSNAVVFVLPYDRSPWVAQFGRDNFAIRSAYPAPVQTEPERRRGARGLPICPRSLVEAGGIPELEACWAEPVGCSYPQAQPNLLSSWLFRVAQFGRYIYTPGAWGGGVIFTATGSYDACPRSTNDSLARRYAFIVASEVSVLKERA
jgi:hypothetical protein